MGNLGLVIAVLLATPPGPAEVDDAATARREVRVWDAATLAPRRAAKAPRSGRLVGLLLPEGPGHHAAQLPLASGGALRLHRGDRAPTPAWFAVQPTPDGPLKTETWTLGRGAKTRAVTAARVPAPHAAAIGLPGPIALVTARVVPSCAKGPCDRVLLTDVAPAPPAEGLALPAADVIDALRRRFGAEHGRHGDRAEAETLARARQDRRGHLRLEHTRFAYWATWQPGPRQLEVVFHVERFHRELGPPKPVPLHVLNGTEPPPCPPCPCSRPGDCAPCTVCQPPTVLRRAERRVGYGLAARYVVDRDARLVREVVYLPRALERADEEPSF